MTGARQRSSAACGFANPAAPIPHQLRVSTVCTAFFTAFLLPTLCFAQRVEIASPLQGYVRTGRCAAIHVTGEGLSGEQISLTGAGVIPIQIPTSAGRIDAIVPLISQGEPPAELTWTDGAASGVVPIISHVLSTDERLVVIAGDPPDAPPLLSEIFPGQRPVLAHVDLTRSRLLQPAMTFESVDAILLDLSAAARMDEGQLRTFLAAGTTVAIHSPQQPIAGWPWRHVQHWWLLQHEVAGPRSGAEPEIYRPTATWDTSWPATMRVTILLTSIAAAIVIAAITLLRPRVLAFSISIALCAAIAVGVAICGARLPKTAVAGGEVLYYHASLSQHDRYTYIAAREATTAAVPAINGNTKPVLWQRRPVDGLSFRLICSLEGAPLRYEVTLPAKFKAAFLSRMVTADPPPADLEQHVKSPLGLFADQLYPGQVIGQTTSPPLNVAVEQWWGTVVLKKP